MKKITQTKLHSEGTNGNCLATAIASLLECTIDEQPQYEELEKWVSPMIRFIKSKGYDFDGTSRMYEIDDFEGVDGYVIVCGASPRGDFSHCVICKDGVMVHDPHPSNDGLKEMETFYRIRKQ